MFPVHFSENSGISKRNHTETGNNVSDDPQIGQGGGGFAGNQQKDVTADFIRAAHFRRIGLSFGQIFLGLLNDAVGIIRSGNRGFLRISFRHIFGSRFIFVLSIKSIGFLVGRI